MKIFNLRLEVDEHVARLRASVESEYFGSKDLWFSLPREHEGALCTTRLDAFLVGLLYPAMYSGEDVHLDGCVSEKLLDNINHYVVPLLRSFSSTLKSVVIHARETTSQRFEVHGVGSGFSGGIDSFCTIIDRYVNEPCENLRINGLTFFNVGSHGNLDLHEAEAKFASRFEHLSGYAKEVGLDLLPLNSNLHEFHPWGHQLTHSLTSASAALALQGRYARYYYSSAGLRYGDAIEFAWIYRDRDIGVYCDPILFPLLSTESMSLVLDGIQYGRVEKTLRVANYEPAHRYLNVCTDSSKSHENCSRCPKCRRTLFTLHHAGRLVEFCRVFDIAKFRKEYFGYACSTVVAARRDVYAKENVECAVKNGHRLPSLPVSFVVVLASKVLRKLRSGLAR